MATVMSKTSQKVDELLADVVVSGAFDSTGRLKLTTWSGAEISAGYGTVPITVKTWDGGTSYNFGDIVGYAGGIYLSRTDDNLNNLPPLDGTIWQAISSLEQTKWIEGDPYFDNAQLTREWNYAESTGTWTQAYTSVAGEFETGPQAVKASLSAGANFHLCQTRENIVHGGETITVSVRARLSTAATGVTLDARLYQNDVTAQPQNTATGLVTTSSIEGAQSLSSTSWTTYTFTLTAANSKLRGTVDLLFASPSAAAVVLIDKVRINRASSPALAPWPVGSVFISVVSTSPAKLLGGGIWSSFASGRSLVGVDLTQTEFNSVEKSGGEKTHTLDVSELPSHTHTINHTHATATSASAGAHTHAVDGNYTIGVLSNTTTGGTGNRYTNSNDAVSRTTGSAGAHTHTVDVPAYSGSSGSAGNNIPHNNLSPYITVYMWKRTA